MKKIYLIATVVAIIAGFATYFFATQIEKQTQIENVEMKNVVVAAVDIPSNTLITADMLLIRSLPVTAVTPGTAETLEEIVGQISHYPFVTGEQMILTKITAAGSSASTGSLSFQLRKDEYAFALTMEGTKGVSGFVCAGDYVDIVVYDPLEEKASVVFENLKVLRISNNAANVAAEQSGTAITSYSDVVFSVTKEQMLRLMEIDSSGTGYKYALKSILNGKEAEEAAKKAQEATPTSETTTAAPSP